MVCSIGLLEIQFVPERIQRMPGIVELAAEAFDRRERVRLLEMSNMPIDYDERKKAFIELELAIAAANEAEAALCALNPHQT